MLFKSGRRYSSIALSSLLLSLILLISCTASETSLPASPSRAHTTIPADATPDTFLDIKFFRAQPKNIIDGEATTLAWNVIGASSLSIEPAIGPVSGNSGSVSIAPKETTLYTLKVSDGRLQTSVKFLVIVKTADGSIIWPNSISDNAKAEQLYEGWSYYPNKYVEWKITERGGGDPYGDMGTCGQIGYITNNHGEWMMTEVSIQNRVVLTFILPGWESGYTTSMDCKQLPELKWKWKIYK
jgi:hypothetical protein